MTDSAREGVYAFTPEMFIAEGMALRKFGRDPEALVMFRRATAFPDAPAKAFFHLGNILFDHGQWVAARKAFIEALELDPSLTLATMQLARCEARRGELLAARAQYANVLRADPDNFIAWLESGHVCRQQGATKQMLAYYWRAIEAAPRHHDCMIALARVVEESGRSARS